MSIIAQLRSRLKYGLLPALSLPLVPKDEQLLIRLRYDSFRKRDIRHHILIFPQQKCIYVETPKAACTSIKRAIFTAAGIALPSTKDLHNFHAWCANHAPGATLSNADFAQALQAENYFRFAFVRNPYTRLYSAWCDKIAHAHDRPETGFDTEYRRIVRYHGLKMGEPVTFDAFVHWLAHAAPSQMNHHWMPQNRVLWMDKLQYAHIGKVEQFEQDMQPVLVHMDSRQKVDLQRRENQSKGAAGSHAYTPSLRRIVNSIYHEDFIRFGYPME